MNRLATMLKSLSFAAAAVVLITACSTPKPKPETAQQPIIDAPVGTIMRRFALQRSLQECKTKNLTDVECKKWIDDAEHHLESVNARIDALLQDPRTNMCHLLRWAGACANPIYTLEDLADCLQLSADSGELQDNGSVVLKLDSRGCPTDK